MSGKYLLHKLQPRNLRAVRASQTGLLHSISHNSVRYSGFLVLENALRPEIRKIIPSWNPSSSTRYFSTSSIIIEPLESLGDSITTAVLVSWSKEAGDAVKEDDVIAIVETDKVTMDIRAKRAGVFIEGLAAAQSEISVGSPLYKIDTSLTTAPQINAETIVTSAKPSSPPVIAVPKVSALTVDVPVMGESITTGMLAKWNFKSGDFVKMDEVVANIETDKVNVEVRSPQSGILQKLFSAEGDEISVGNPLFDLQPSEASNISPTSATTAAPAAAAPVKAAALPAKSTPATPPVVVKAAQPVVPKPSSPPPAGDRSETRVKMTRMRLRIAQRLKEAQNTAAMLTTFQEVDMGSLIEMRNKHKVLTLFHTALSYPDSQVSSTFFNPLLISVLQSNVL